MRIGYSFWGFLGPGITDTPDGGRSHRRPLVDALLDRGHDIVFLQTDRDRVEAGDHLGGVYSFDAHGFPDIDVLFLEWRWPIEGRNTTPCGSPGHTCDLHRQTALLGHYARPGGTPTLIWDKDRRLSPQDPWRHTLRVHVCEAALNPSTGAHRLLFPVDDALLDAADPVRLAAQPRPISLGYAGNQYDRDNAFDTFFAPAARHIPHQIAGKWPRQSAWPHVTFLERVPFTEVHRLYERSLATLLLLPERYAAAGQMTQRIFEAVLAGCLPLAPANITGVEAFVPPSLIVSDGDGVTRRIAALRCITGCAEHAGLIAACLRQLDLFRLSHQVEALESLMARAVDRTEGAAR